MPTEDAYSSGHLVLSRFGTCKCSNVETNLSWICRVSGLLGFEHPSVLLFLLLPIQKGSHRTFAAGVDSRQGHLLLLTANPSHLGIAELVETKTCPAHFWTLGLSLLRYSIAILYCCHSQWRSSVTKSGGAQFFAYKWKKNRRVGLL